MKITILIQKISLILLFIIFSRVTASKAETNIEYFFGKTSQSKYSSIKVKNVLRADTIVLENNEKVKLIGLKSPNPPKEPTARDKDGNLIKIIISPLTSIEERALSFTKKLIENKKVRLEFDVQSRNDTGRLLAYIFLLDDNNTFINAEILKNGFANLHIRIPNIKYKNELREAYKESRAEKRGLQGE